MEKTLIHNHWSLGMRLCCVFTVALAVRLLVLWLLFPRGGWSEVGYGSELGQIAANLAEGRGYSSPFSNGTQPTAWVAPLVPMVWAAVFNMAGVYSRSSLVYLGVLQCVISAGACCFYYLILMRLLSPVRESRWPWVLGGMAVLMFWPLCLKAAVTFWYFAWQECAVAGLFWASIMWLSRRTWGWALVLGLCSGWVALINPVPLVVFVGIIIAVWRATNDYPKHGHSLSLIFTSQRLHLLGLLCLSMAVMVILVAPWMLRNAKIFRAFIPARSAFGITLWQGNNPHGVIVQTASSLHPALNVQEKNKFIEMGEYEYDRAARKSAIQYMQCNPWKTAKRTLQRVYVFWCSDVGDDWPWMLQPNSHHGTWWSIKRSVVAMLWVGLLVVLMWVLMPGRIHRVPFIEIFIALFILYPLPFYVTSVSPMYAYVVQPYIIILFITELYQTRQAARGFLRRFD